MYLLAPIEYPMTVEPKSRIDPFVIREATQEGISHISGAKEGAVDQISHGYSAFFCAVPQGHQARNC